MNRTAAVITVSDKGARGERRDTSGPAVRAPPRPSRPAAPSEGARPSGGAACGPQSCRRKLLPAIYAKGTGLAQSGPGLEPGPDCSPLRGR